MSDWRYFTSLQLLTIILSGSNKSRTRWMADIFDFIYGYSIACLLFFTPLKRLPDILVPSAIITTMVNLDKACEQSYTLELLRHADRIPFWCGALFSMQVRRDDQKIIILERSQQGRSPLMFPKPGSPAVSEFIFSENCFLKKICLIYHGWLSGVAVNLAYHPANALVFCLPPLIDCQQTCA